MEKLDQPSPVNLFTKETIYEVRKLLDKIHSKKPLNLHYAQHNTWREELEKFMNNYPELVDAGLVRKFYPNKLNYINDVCLIHGDPTLANTMLRNKKIVLIDPISPRGKIPHLKEVDYGKMLQSALGWEKIQQKKNYGYDTNQLISSVLENIPNEKIVWFWGMIHILRIVPRAQKHSHIIQWCRDTIQLCKNNI